MVLKPVRHPPCQASKLPPSPRASSLRHWGPAARSKVPSYHVHEPVTPRRHLEEDLAACLGGLNSRGSRVDRRPGRRLRADCGSARRERHRRRCAAHAAGEPAASDGHPPASRSCGHGSRAGAARVAAGASSEQPSRGMAGRSWRRVRARGGGRVARGAAGGGGGGGGGGGRRWARAAGGRGQQAAAGGAAGAGTRAQREHTAARAARVGGRADAGAVEAAQERGAGGFGRRRDAGLMASLSRPGRPPRRQRPCSSSWRSAEPQLAPAARAARARARSRAAGQPRGGRGHHRPEAPPPEQLGKVSAEGEGETDYWRRRRRRRRRRGGGGGRRGGGGGREAERSVS